MACCTPEKPALRASPPQEPVAWFYRHAESGREEWWHTRWTNIPKSWTEIPLYAQPPHDTGEVARLRKALKRCGEIVERYNHRQNEKIEDVKLIVRAALNAETPDAR